MMSIKWSSLTHTSTHTQNITNTTQPPSEPATRKPVSRQHDNKINGVDGYEPITTPGVNILTNEMADPYPGPGRDACSLVSPVKSMSTWTNHIGDSIRPIEIEQYRACTRHLPIWSTQLYCLKRPDGYKLSGPLQIPAWPGYVVNGIYYTG